MFIEHVLCARSCPKLLGHINVQNRQKPVLGTLLRCLYIHQSYSIFTFLCRFVILFILFYGEKKLWLRQALVVERGSIRDGIETNTILITRGSARLRGADWTLRGDERAGVRCHGLDALRALVRVAQHVTPANMAPPMVFQYPRGPGSQDGGSGQPNFLRVRPADHAVGGRV